MLEAFNYLYAYYRSYTPLLAVFTCVMVFMYWIVANWGLLRATHRCVNLKNTVTGNIGKCFTSVEGASCQKTDLGYIYGWCNDANNYGPLPGNKAGPYTGQCLQWSWCNGQCPPQQCLGAHPKGIDGQDPQMWGWCADEGVERAMIGTSCGPRNDKCNNWIWEAKKCPTSCQRPTQKQSQSQSCSSKDDKCECKGPPSDPWKLYENKRVYISSSIDNAHCYLKSSETRGAIAGLTDTEKAAKFSCNEDSSTKGDIYNLEKSVDSKYRIKDSEGCTLRWSSLKGGNKALGTEDMMAKFDCTDTGEPLELEGTPDRAQFYGIIGSKKCGLQWSPLSGQNPGISNNEHVAKFGCLDPGDTVTVDLV